MLIFSILSGMSLTVVYLALRRRWLVSCLTLLLFSFESSNLLEIGAIEWTNVLRYFVLAAISVVLWFANLGKRKSRGSAIIWAAWLFIIWSAIGAWTAEYWEEGALRVLTFAVLAVASFGCFRLDGDEGLLALNSAGLVFSSVLVILSFATVPINPAYLHGSGRFQGIFVNPNNLAAVCVVTILTSLIFLVRHRGGQKAIGIVSIIVSGSALVLTGSRGGMAAVIIGAFVFSLHRMVGNAVRTVWRTRILLITGTAIAMWLVFSGAFSVNEIATEHFSRGRNFWSYRYDFFLNGMDSVRSSPLFGQGLGSTRVNWRLNLEKDFERVHQLGYVTAAVETGVPGAALLLLFFVAVGMRALLLVRAKGSEGSRQARDVLSAITSLYSGMFVLGIFEDYPVSVGTCVTVIMWLTAGAVARIPVQDRNVSKRRTGIRSNGARLQTVNASNETFAVPRTGSHTA